MGSTTSSATITATVRDIMNNAVAGAVVSFNITDGPGGGEFLSPIFAVTDAAGRATTTLTSGSSTSAQDGVVVRATTGAFFDEATLTIGQTAARIVFGTSNKISKVTSNGLEVGYALPYVLVVTDNNGNAIPNQDISLGLVMKSFRTGVFTDSSVQASGVVTGTFENEDRNQNGIMDNFLPTSEDLNCNNRLDIYEDLNNNGILDRGEDGAFGQYDFGLGFVDAYYYSYAPLGIYEASVSCPVNNGTTGLNGMLDPGNLATIPSSVTTDENGLAAFEVIYPKSYGLWVDVTLRATTSVSGSETSVSLDTSLSVMYGDAPYIDSPFGN